MSIFESLTSNRKKFLQSLGINSDEDMPESFFDIIQDCRKTLSPSEYFYAGTPSASGNYYLPFCIKDLAGTNHDRYVGKTWIDAFCDLDRGEELLEKYFANPDYYSSTLRSEDEFLEHSSSIGIIRKDGKSYVYSAAGGGNNRMILMKIRYLAMAARATEEELRQIDALHTFYGNTRIIPENIELPNVVEQLLWNHVDKKYKPENISTNPNVRVFNMIRGTFMNNEVVGGPFTEEEFVAYAKDLIKSFSPQGEEVVIK